MRNVAASRVRSAIWSRPKRWRARSIGRAARCAKAICSRKKPIKRSNCTISTRRLFLSAIQKIRIEFAGCCANWTKGLDRFADRGKQRARRNQRSVGATLQLADIFEQFCASQLLDTLNIKRSNASARCSKRAKDPYLAAARSRPGCHRQRVGVARAARTKSADDADCYFWRNHPAGESRHDSSLGHSNRPDYPQRSAQGRRSFGFGRCPAALFRATVG